MKQRKHINVLLKITLVIISVAPVLYLHQIESVPFKAFILGTGSWGIGLILKMIAHQLVLVPLQKHNSSPLVVSIINGFISGIFELSAAAGVIFLMKDKFAFDYYSIIGFGLAIGSFESLIIAFNSGESLLKGTALEKTTEQISQQYENAKGFKQLLYYYFYPVLERVLATLIHISTRGLIFVAVFQISLFPIIIALVVFIIADGLLGYYFNITGKLLTNKGFFQVYIYLVLLTAFVSITFFFLIAPYKELII